MTRGRKPTHAALKVYRGNPGKRRVHADVAPPAITLPKAPEHFAKTSIALIILENGGQSYVNLLLDQAMNVPDTAVAATPAAAPTARQDTVVRRLVENYDLEGLVALTDQLTSDEAIQSYVREAAKPNPAISQAEQKATIAHFLLQQIGAETINRVTDTAVA